MTITHTYKFDNTKHFITVNDNVSSGDVPLSNNVDSVFFDYNNLTKRFEINITYKLSGYYDLDGNEVVKKFKSIQYLQNLN